MKLYVAADHAGFRMKEVLRDHFALRGYDVEDLGAASFDQDDDYPDFATVLALRVARDPESKGILCCGTGQGEGMVANKITGVRAGVFYGLMAATEELDREGARSKDGYDIVRLTRSHNDANVLCIGARFVSASEALEAAGIFLETPFSGDERHMRRIAKF